MKQQAIKLILTLAAVLSISSCSPNLKSQSGLYSVPLTHTYKVPVDGYWINESKSELAGVKSGSIYIAPLNVESMRKKYPDYADLLQEQMQDHMMKEYSEKLALMNKMHNCHWTLTNNPANANVSVKLAIVKFSPQRPIAKVLSSIGGWFISVPGVSSVAGKISAGNIALEGVISNARTGTTILAFKDSNRKTTRLYHKNAYTETGQADQNLQHWAERLANILVTIKFDATGHSNLKAEIEESGLDDIISKRVKTAI